MTKRLGNFLEMLSANLNAQPIPVKARWHAPATCPTDLNLYVCYANYEITVYSRIWRKMYT